MSRNAPPLDVDGLMRAINPQAAPPSSEVVEAALQRLLAEPELAAATPAGGGGFPGHRARG